MRANVEMVDPFPVNVVNGCAEWRAV